MVTVPVPDDDDGLADEPDESEVEELAADELNNQPDFKVGSVASVAALSGVRFLYQYQAATITTIRSNFFIFGVLK